MIRTTIFLTPQQLERLRLESKTRGLPMSEIVRRAIDEYFLRRPARQNEREERDG